MKKYFIHDGQKKIGPFSAMELIERGITKCTPVYTAGLGRYVTAAEIPVLNDALGKMAEGTTDSLTEPGKKKNTAAAKKIGLAIAGLLIVGVPLLIYLLRPGVPNVPSTIMAGTAFTQQNIQLKTAIEQKEAANPLQYLSVHGKMHSNLIGKKIIKGSIVNVATLAAYKNVELAITFLSENQADLQTQHFFVNDFIAPNNETSFRNVFTAPPETEGFRIKVLSATPAP